MAIVSFEEWKKQTGGAGKNAIGSTKVHKQATNADDYSTNKPAKKKDSGIVTASDEKKSKSQSPEIKALGAGNYGADKDTRVDKVLRGAGESTAASYINTAATLAGGTGELTMGQSAQAAVKGQSQQKLEQEKKKKQDKVQQKLYKTADKLSEKSAKEINSAKDGLGKVGQILVDAGVAGTQMLGDAALNIVTPGAGIVGMGLRSFGSGAQEQRQRGGSETDQFLGGLKSAGIEVLTEKIGGPFEKVYGKSFIGKAVNNGVEKLSKSGAMASVLKFVANGGTEALEEVLSDVLNPLADRLLDLDGKRGSGEAIGVFSKENIQQMIDDALVGGLLGMIGAGGQVVGENVAKNQQRAQAQETARNAAQEALAGRQQTTPTAETNADTVQQVQLNSALLDEQPQVAANPLVAAVQNAQRQQAQTATPTLANESVETDTAQIVARVEQTIDDIVATSIENGENLTDEQALAEIAQFPEQYGLTTADVEEYSASLRDYGLGAANKGFEENMDMATSKYRTNSMERNYDPDSLSDNGFEIESGNFDHKIKHNADTMTSAQTMFDYYMEDGGIDAVKEAIFNENLSGAERGTLAEIAQKYIVEQERNALYDNEISAEDYDNLVKDRLEIAKAKSSLLTEAGQTLQAQSMWNRSDDPNTIFGDAADALTETGLDADEQKARLRQLDGWLTRLEDINPKSKQAMGEMKSLIKEIADKRGVTRLALANGKTAPIANTIIDWALDRLDYNQLKQLAMNSAQQSVFDLTQEADVGQKLKAVQVMFMLSRPKTLNRNLTGNGSFSAVDTISMNGAALADMLLSQVTGTRSVAADKGLFSKTAWNGMGDAAVKSIAEIMLDANMGAENRYQMTSSRTFKADGGMIERIFSVLERENALRMVMTDEVAKASTRERSKEEIQKLIDEGKIKGADENYAQEYSDYLAKERTFQQDSGIADVISTLHDALNAWVGIGDSGRTYGKKNHTVHSFGAGDIVAPFTKVAGNLVATAYNYSTVKAVTGFADMCNVIYDAKTNGTIDPAKQAKAVKDFARGVNGTAFTLICFALAKAKLLKRADDEDDADVAALNAAEGMTGTQLNIDAIGRLLQYGDNSWQTGDKLLDISSLEPLNTLMAVGTVAADWNEDSRLDNIFKVLDTFGESAEELPVLQFKANVDNDVKYGDKKSEAIAKESINTVISSLIPNIVSGVASGSDEYYRDIYSGDNYWENVRDNVKSRLPFARETLPTKQTPFGKDKKYPDTSLTHFLNALANPVGINRYEQTNLSKEFQSVREASGAVNFYPDKSAPTSVTYKRETYDLSYEERQKYLKVTGEYYERIGSQAISSSTYKNFSDEEKAEFLNTVRSEAEKAAKASVLRSRGIDTNYEKKTAQELLEDTAYKFASGNEDIYIRVSTGDSIKGKLTALQNGYDEQKILDGLSDDAKERFSRANGNISLETFLTAYDYYKSGSEVTGDDKWKDVAGYINGMNLTASEKESVFRTIYKDKKRNYNWVNGGNGYSPSTSKSQTQNKAPTTADFLMGVFR